MKNKKNKKIKGKRSVINARQIYVFIALASCLLLFGTSLWCFSFSHNNAVPRMETYEDCLNFLYDHSNLGEFDLKQLKYLPEKYCQVSDSDSIGYRMDTIPYHSIDTAKVILAANSKAEGQNSGLDSLIILAFTPTPETQVADSSQSVYWTTLTKDECEQFSGRIKWNEEPKDLKFICGVALAILAFFCLALAIVLFILSNHKKNIIDESKTKEINKFFVFFENFLKRSKEPDYSTEPGNDTDKEVSVTDVPLTIIDNSFHEGMSTTEILTLYDKLYGTHYDDGLDSEHTEKKIDNVSVPSPVVENPFNGNMSIPEILSQFDKLFNTDVSGQFSSYVSKKEFDDLQKKANDFVKQNAELKSAQGNLSADIETLQKSESALKSEIEELKESRTKWQNQTKQITDSKDLKALHAALKSLGYTKLSSLVDAVVKETEKEIKERYRKESEQLVVLSEKAKNWDDLMSVTKEDVLLKKWDKLREDNVKLPVIHTVSWAYNEALNDVDKKKVIPSDLIYKYLVVTFKLVSDDYKLSDAYQKIVAMAVNWQKYEKIVQTVNNFAHDSVVSKVIATKDWKYWDRLAMMVRSLDFVHNLLLMFEDSGYANVKRDIRPVLAQVTSDFSQLYLFRYYVRDLKASYDYRQFDSDLEAIRNTFSTVNGDYALDCSLDSYAETVQSLRTAYNSIKGTQAFSSQMWNQLVNDFISNAPSNKDQAWFFSRVVAIAYHASDFIAGLNGRDSIFLYNQRFVMSGLNRRSLDNDLVRFEYKDYQYSNDYTNRVYEWLNSLGVEHLPALVDNKLIMP